MTPPLIKRYLVALDRHKWAGLAGFVIVMGMSTAAALQPKPPANYVSSGVLAYSSAPITLSQTGAALQQQGQALTAEVLLSDQVINLAAQKLETDPAVVRQGASVKTSSRAAASSGSRAQRDQANAASGGFRVTVIYQDREREQAEQTVTELMTAMVEQSRLFSTQQLTAMISNLGQLRSEIDRDLQQAEQNLEQYVRTQKPSILAAREGELIGAITSSESQQRQIQLSLQGIDAQIRSLESRLGLSADQAYASAALSADPIIADLRGQIHGTESQIQILQQDLRPDHPNMVQLRHQQQSYEQLLRTRVEEVIGGNQIAAPLSTDSQLRQGISLDPARQELANTLVALQTQRDTLRQQLTTLTQLDQQMRQQYSTLPPDRRIQQARLQQQVTLKQAFYDQIQQRLEDARLAEKETVGSLIVAQPPQTELSVVDGPSSVVILLVGGLVGLLVGGGLVLLLDSLDAKFHTLQDVQTALRQQEVPVLGLLPLLPLELEANGLLLVTPADSHYIEPYERFRSNLRRVTGGKALKTILITSTVNGEGKTVSAYNLAIASARAGKRTLLIEADLRSPSQAKSLKVALDPESSAEPLRYYGHLSDCIRLVPEIENLYLLPSPGVQRQASALLESSEMRRMLEDVRGRFDLVILDTPALSRCNDALLLEPYGDGLILVTRPGYTEEGLLTEAIEQFTESEDIQFLGAIINGADIPMQSAFYEETETYYNIVPNLESEDLEKIGIPSNRV